MLYIGKRFIVGVESDGRLSQKSRPQGRRHNKIMMIIIIMIITGAAGQWKKSMLATRLDKLTSGRRRPQDQCYGGKHHESHTKSQALWAAI